MNHRFVLKKRGPRHFWWDVNDHLIAVMEHAPDGPWADVPVSLAEDIRTVTYNAFGDKRFTLAQFFAGYYLLALPALQWPPNSDNKFGQELYQQQIVRYGIPVAQNARHAGRLFAEALRTDGWRIWAEDGMVKFQKQSDTPIARVPSDNRDLILI